jgi:hypothetical protein
MIISFDVRAMGAEVIPTLLPIVTRLLDNEKLFIVQAIMFSIVLAWKRSVARLPRLPI